MLMEKTVALGNKLTPAARWVLGLSAPLWLVASFYKLWIGDYGMAAILLAWAAAHGTSWIIFDRRRIFALIFGALASSLYLQVSVVKVDSWGNNAPPYLRVIELGCLALFLIFLFAMVAQIRFLVEQREPKKWLLRGGLLNARNYPAWLLARGFVQSEKWRGFSVTAGILGAMFWTFAQWGLTYRSAPNTPALTIGIAVAKVFVAYLLFLPLFFAVPWTAVQLVGWVVQRLSQPRNST